MAVFATNIHPSFAETARRRGYLLNDEVSDAEFAGLERQVADLERQIASVDPAAIAEAIRARPLADTKEGACSVLHTPSPVSVSVREAAATHVR